MANTKTRGLRPGKKAPPRALANALDHERARAPRRDADAATGARSTDLPAGA